MHRLLPFTLPAGLLAATSAAKADDYILTIAFTPLNSAVSASPVPIGPLAVGLCILAIGGVLAYASRKGKKHWLSLPAIAAVVGLGLSQPTSTEAQATPPRSISLTSSPVNTPLEAPYSQSFQATNPHPYSVQIESVSLTQGPYSIWRPAEPPQDVEGPFCQEGLVLTANQSCRVYILVPN